MMNFYFLKQNEVRVACTKEQLLGAISNLDVELLLGYVAGLQL